MKNYMGSSIKSGSIRINQVGYRQNDTKVAFIAFDKEEEFKAACGQPFYVYKTYHKLTFSGKLKPAIIGLDSMPVKDIASGEFLLQADFSAVHTEGQYFLEFGSDRSPEFRIGKDVYKDLTNALLLMFYYQRCGRDGVKAEYTDSLFAHDPCHTALAKYYDESDPIYGYDTADVSGGWHDAGDFGRYVTPAVKAVADLLLAYEHFPKIAHLDFGGPEFLLGEVRYEIEWLLKMQNHKTGGVYHKVTTKNHADPMSLPQDDNAPLFLAPVSAQATGNFAASMAFASRIFREDLVFANTCIRAAEKAWSWLTANTDADIYLDPPFFRTGGYIDQNSRDERCWAAVELYRTTGEAGYLDYLAENPPPEPGFGWADVGSYAMTSYLLSEQAGRGSGPVAQKTDLYHRIKANYMKSVDDIMDISSGDGYKVSLNRYVWGSNMDVANNAMALILADMIEPDPKYKKVILDQLHYLLGRNTNDISYVTCFGAKSAQNPHHRPSMRFGRTYPGMLVGGPFANVSSLTKDPLSGLFTESTPPGKCYIDASGSFSMNEICIYWNSPLVFVMAYLGR